MTFPMHSCGARLHPAHDVTPEEEEEANRYAPAAILVCPNGCGVRVVLEGTNRHPKARAARVPDQSVFDVTP